MKLKWAFLKNAALEQVNIQSVYVVSCSGVCLRVSAYVYWDTCFSVFTLLKRCANCS